MRTITHPLSGATYDLTDDGNIEVTKDNQSGMFNQHGQWLSGTIRHADPHLCRWIAGEKLGAPAGSGSPADRRSVARGLGSSTGSTPSVETGSTSTSTISQETSR